MVGIFNIGPRNPAIDGRPVHDCGGEELRKALHESQVAVHTAVDAVRFTRPVGRQRPINVRHDLVAELVIQRSTQRSIVILKWKGLLP